MTQEGLLRTVFQVPLSRVFPNLHHSQGGNSSPSSNSFMNHCKMEVEAIRIQETSRMPNHEIKPDIRNSPIIMPNPPARAPPIPYPEPPQRLSQSKVSQNQTNVKFIHTNQNPDFHSPSNNPPTHNPIKKPTSKNTPPHSRRVIKCRQRIRRYPIISKIQIPRYSLKKHNQKNKKNLQTAALTK